MRSPPAPTRRNSIRGAEGRAYQTDLCFGTTLNPVATLSRRTRRPYTLISSVAYAETAGEHAAGTVDATLLREMFLQCLPTNVRMVIT